MMHGSEKSRPGPATEQHTEGVQRLLIVLEIWMVKKPETRKKKTHLTRN
jgi:hypothetical protein